MNIELKNVQHFERMSEETDCYSASLYVDGVKIGEVSNRGCGGCDEFHGDRAAYDRADRWCRESLPKLPPLFEDGEPMEQTIETVCHDRLTDWLLRRDMKRAMARRALFVKPDHAGKVFQLGYRGTAKPDERLFAEVERRHPDATILNRLPEAEALRLYKGEGEAAPA